MRNSADLAATRESVVREFLKSAQAVWWPLCAVQRGAQAAGRGNKQKRNSADLAAMRESVVREFLRRLLTTRVLVSRPALPSNDRRSVAMPELPDIDAYLYAMDKRITGATLETVRLGTPFLLRSVKPTLAEMEGRKVKGLRRVGKRICIGLEPDYWLVLHLMIAGRLHWHNHPPKLSKRVIAGFDFSTGSLSLTEAGSKKRASLQVVAGEKALLSLDPGGIDVMTADLPAFAAALTAHNHTLKRALTDPRIFSGIGNAYSDEILHRAQLSPIKLTSKLTPDQIQTLFSAVRATLEEWTASFIEEARDKFPENVTAFREGMAVHGRYGEPCPRCGTKVQRIRYADNETNYCPTCQTGGGLLADRALSRLLRDDWPRTLEELEAIKRTN